MTNKFQNLTRRAEIIRAARSFFHLEGFLEVETPILTDEPLPEANIEGKFSSVKNNILNAELCPINVTGRRLLEQAYCLCQSTGWQQEIGFILYTFSLTD